MKKIQLSLSVILCCFLFGNCQNNEKEKWTDKEKQYYKTLTGLVEYIAEKPENMVSNDTLFTKFIYFDNVLKDNDKDRKQQRIAVFDTIFSYVPKKIDSIGLENLDAKPLRFYKDHQIFEPFKKALLGVEKNVLVYYAKNNPNEPLGTLLFEKDSGKLAAWILMRQGDSGWFYLTFNLL